VSESPGTGSLFADAGNFDTGEFFDEEMGDYRPSMLVVE
jgi:hypothetical protein